MKTILNFTLAVSVAMILGACGDKTPALDLSPAEKLKPSRPARFYEIKDGTDYGYARPVSENDRNQGRVANTLLMASYLGKKGAAYQVMLKEDRLRTVAECELPCRFAKIYVFYDVEFLRKEILPVNDGMLLHGIFSDAINGHLEQRIGQRDGTAVTYWVDSEKKRLLVQDAKTSGITP